MKATELTLLCHGSTRSQRLGRFQQADEPLETPLAPRPWSPSLQGLVAPERRTRHTAQALGLAARLEPALRDLDLGRWQGKSLKHLQLTASDALQQWLDDPDAAPHGGESVRQLGRRIGAWLDQGLAPGQWVAVTHPWVVRAALQHVLGGPLTAARRIDVLPLGEVRMSWHGHWRLRLA